MAKIIGGIQVRRFRKYDLWNNTLFFVILYLATILLRGWTGISINVYRVNFI